MQEVLEGLTPEDAQAAIIDYQCFGTVMVFIDADGVKRRIPPDEWVKQD